jgi:2'-5' RNA ligase
MVMLGVAVAVPEPHSSVLQRWRARVGDPQADIIWPHVTLLPPTEVGDDLLDVIDAHLADAAKGVEPFAMHLFGTGTFRPVSPVVFVQIARGVASCELLERAIRTGPLDRRLDYPYHPHVTVAHDIDDAALDEAYEGLAGFIARFTVLSFQLFERLPDGAWRQLREYPLGGA